MLPGKIESIIKLPVSLATPKRKDSLEAGRLQIWVVNLNVEFTNDEHQLGKKQKALKEEGVAGNIHVLLTLLTLLLYGRFSAHINDPATAERWFKARYSTLHARVEWITVSG